MQSCLCRNGTSMTDCPRPVMAGLAPVILIPSGAGAFLIEMA